MKINIQKVLTLILLSLLGISLILGGLKFHNSVVNSYDCKTCSIFDEECVDGYHSEENKECLYSLEWPWKFSLVPIFVGIMLIFFPVIILVLDKYDKYKSNKINNKSSLS